MTSLYARVAALFVLTAVLPVVLTALVWAAVTRWDADDGSAEAELVQAVLAAKEERRGVAVEALCRDDLVVDLLMRTRSGEDTADLDYDRLVAAKMQVAGLQALWVLDSSTGERLATGHRQGEVPATEATLLSRARAAGSLDFVIDGAGSEHRTFVARACTIQRGSSSVTVIGAHRVANLLATWPDRLALRDKAREGDVALRTFEGVDASSNVLVLRAEDGQPAPPLWLWLGCVAALTIGLALVFGGYLTRWLQSSVDGLTAAATRIGAGDLHTTLKEGDQGAFKATATAFNRMTRDLRSAREQLRQTERIAAWQDIAKRLAHELKNPLSPIRLSIETLRKAHSRSHAEFDALFEETSQTILQEVERLRRIIDEFSRFARLPAPTLRATDLRQTVSHVVSLYTEGAVAVSAELPEAPVVASVDAEQITQVVHNLLQNGADAAKDAHPSGGGSVCVRLEEGLGEVRIVVMDNGAGISNDRQTLVFEPYYTDKEGGSGLGLAISSRIVTEHGGRITLASEPGRTVFAVVLPKDTVTQLSPTTS
ncbi:MAG: ATP-binding protein [Myxococcota bacterium]